MVGAFLPPFSSLYVPSCTLSLYVLCGVAYLWKLTQGGGKPNKTTYYLHDINYNAFFTFIKIDCLQQHLDACIKTGGKFSWDKKRAIFLTCWLISELLAQFKLLQLTNYSCL
jgi:hypothetical protein